MLRVHFAEHSVRQTNSALLQITPLCENSGFLMLAEKIRTALFNRATPRNGYTPTVLFFSSKVTKACSCH